MTKIIETIFPKDEYHRVLNAINFLNGDEPNEGISNIEILTSKESGIIVLVSMSAPSLVSLYAIGKIVAMDMAN